MLKTKILITVSLALLTSGCAELEVSPGKRSNFKNAPVNETNRAGIVSYGNEVIDDDERQEAYNIMSESCHGSYKIVNETLRRGSGDYFGDNGKFILGMDEDRVYIHFVCVN